MQNTSKKLASFVIGLTCLILLGCRNPSQGMEAEPRVIEKAASVETIKEVRAPLNCPVMLTSSPYFSKRDNRQYLSFYLQDNPDFDDQRGDVCKGDIKNLWSDLTRSEADIEAGYPRLKSIGGFTNQLHNFPKTERELKTFIDQAARAVSLSAKLDKIDRSTLEGGMEHNAEIRRLIVKAMNEYWLSQHGVHIEKILSKYEVKLDRFGGEKYAYCYRPANLCRGYVSLNGLKPEDKSAADSEYELEYLWSVMGGFSFQSEGSDKIKD